ncbi:hydantoinase/oxoprolinase family protein [Rhizobium alvei]|uniref:Hydantoinase/oxoprolinase family protein n=1 Tax=Rhizobium alvei TaxID=1132659 RepID=A0ABT8YN01_9HYPH|nr:hydantoinase/oxoprolinase family protein [Rhizobium alvei]MDO6964674.1 hydantoinase/oxoprolinase family protein [Rhizobium alvei]
MASQFLLGIDTGGTYTDAVLFSPAEGVTARAKSLTTRHDLAEGIRGAVDNVLRDTGTDPRDIRLASLSTTLATNALVEGQGGRVCLVMIGFGPEDLERDGLKTAIGSDPVLFLPGGHNVHGHENPLVMAGLEAEIDGLSQSVSAFAVAGYFAVRNPEHELRVRDFIRSRTGLPVTCSHDLSSKLGGPRRALTTLLNARLVSMIDRLIGSCEDFLRNRGVDAPLMVVRGDGALISSGEARLRPIETILSGPAASLVGARFLTGLDNAVVSDIGGTTTDVAILDNGKPRLDENGAVVGGYRTMVQAVAMRTYGLGGDSEVHVDIRSLDGSLNLGPRRILPLSLIAHLHGDGVVEMLDRQLKAAHAGRYDGRFAVRSGLPDRFASGLSNPDQALYARIGQEPIALNDLLTTSMQKASLDRLVARGLVHLCGVTPSDAMHLVGRQGQWRKDAARLGLEILARSRDASGKPIADTPEEMAAKIEARMTLQSSQVILAAALGEDGVEGVDPARSVPVARSLARTPGVVRFSMALDRPLIGLGASAHVYYPAIAAMLAAESVIPSDAGVANAIGAVAGEISQTVTVVVTSPEEGIYIVSGGGETLRRTGEAQTLAMARERALEAARSLAIASGAEEPVLSMNEVIEAPEIEGSRKLVEARFVATASGRPKIT